LQTAKEGDRLLDRGAHLLFTGNIAADENRSALSSPDGAHDPAPVTFVPADYRDARSFPGKEESRAFSNAFGRAADPRGLAGQSSFWHDIASPLFC
jgi:hypothetical protein